MVGIMKTLDVHFSSGRGWNTGWPAKGGIGGMAPVALCPLAPRGPSTCSVCHLHTLLNLAVLFLAQARDPSRQHAPTRPDELTEQQNILGERANCRESAGGCLTQGARACGLQGRLSYPGTPRR